MKFRPLENRVLIRPDAPRERAGSIIIPEAHRKPTGYGTVVAMGPGSLMPDGSRHPMPDGLNVGDRVVFDAQNPWPTVTLDGETLLQLRDDTVLGVVEE